MIVFVVWSFCTAFSFLFFFTFFGGGGRGGFWSVMLLIFLPLFLPFAPLLFPYFFHFPFHLFFSLILYFPFEVLLRGREGIERTSVHYEWILGIYPQFNGGALIQEKPIFNCGPHNVTFCLQNLI